MNHKVKLISYNNKISNTLNKINKGFFCLHNLFTDMFSTKHWLDTEQVYSYDYLVDFRHSFSYIKLTVLIIETNFTLNMLVVTSDSAPELACWSHNYYIWFRFVYLRDWDLCSWFLVFLKIHFLKIPGWVCHLVAWSCVASADMEIGEIAVSHGISVFLHFPKVEYWK